MIDEIKIGDWLYINEADNSNRYVLGQHGSNPLIVFGVNPSVAEPAYLGSSDPTIDKVKKIATKLECNGWIMLNVYPQRSTDPNGMHMVLDEKIHARNLQLINQTLDNYPNAKIVAAWGNIIVKRYYLIKCLNDINKILMSKGIEWNCFEVNKTQHPKHPLYLKVESSSLKKFNFEPYTQ